MIAWALALILWTVCAMFCSLVAPMRGRDAGSWFIIGLSIGILAPLLLFGLPDLTKEAPLLPPPMPRWQPTQTQARVIAMVFAIALMGAVALAWWLALPS
jgi:hypothetical protein